MTTDTMDTPDYALSLRVLHWLTVGLILTMLPIGAFMSEMAPGRLQNLAFHYHRSTGFVLLVLTLLRIASRFVWPPKPLPPDIPVVQARVAKTVQGLLYLFLIVNPMVGWVATNAFGARIEVFGLFTLPLLVEKDRALAKTLFEWHTILGFAMVGVLALHILGVLYHHFIRKDQVLMRMTTGRPL